MTIRWTVGRGNIVEATIFPVWNWSVRPIIPQFEGIACIHDESYSTPTIGGQAFRIPNIVNQSFTTPTISDESAKVC
jgi:hypothetical protein